MPLTPPVLIMMPDQNPTPSAADLVALRDQPDALKAIVGRLDVKEMGPADHIRTKHEVKAFIDARGNVQEAEAILTRARARRELWRTQAITHKMSERQGRGRVLGD